MKRENVHTVGGLLLNVRSSQGKANKVPKLILIRTRRSIIANEKRFRTKSVETLCGNFKLKIF